MVEATPSVVVVTAAQTQRMYGVEGERACLQTSNAFHNVSRRGATATSSAETEGKSRLLRRADRLRAHGQAVAGPPGRGVGGHGGWRRRPWGSAVHTYSQFLVLLIAVLLALNQCTRHGCSRETHGWGPGGLGHGVRRSIRNLVAYVFVSRHPTEWVFLTKNEL